MLIHKSGLALKKRADYWDKERDPYYGVRYVYQPGAAPEGYTNPLQLNHATQSFRLNIPSWGELSDNDVYLLENVKNQNSPEQLQSLWIYHQLVRGALFNRNDPTYNQLRREFPSIAAQADRAVTTYVKNNPRAYAVARTLGENMLGAEVDYIADKNLAEHLAKTNPDWGEATEEGVELSDKATAFLNESRRRTNSYSFANYAPSMLAAGLAPAAIGAFMGRPFLGLLLGAMLSGGIGYYGYNRLNNPQFQGFSWADKMLGYAPNTNSTEEAARTWEYFNQPIPTSSSSGTNVRQRNTNPNRNQQTVNNSGDPVLQDNEPAESSDEEFDDLGNILNQEIEPIQ